ncbi:MAG: NAD(P)-binding protein [Candidatus Micrarchaeota archaeon]
MQVDVAIAGASFAGLGVAHYLRDAGFDVLLIDRKDVGEGRTSTCGVPKRLVDEVAPGTILRTVKNFYIETQRLRRKFEIPEEYGVIDYKKSCVSLFEKSAAGFMKAEVLGTADGKINTSEGGVEAKFIIDCTGWRRVLSGNKGAGKLLIV